MLQVSIGQVNWRQ